MSLNKPKTAWIPFYAVIQLKQHKTYRYYQDIINIEFDSEPEDGTTRIDKTDIENIALMILRHKLKPPGTIITLDIDTETISISD